MRSISWGRQAGGRVGRQVAVAGQKRSGQSEPAASRLLQRVGAVGQAGQPSRLLVHECLSVKSSE